MTPADFGAVGDGNTANTDDTAALQAALNSFKSPPTTNVPGTVVGTGFKNRQFNGRVLDLDGKVYNVTAPLNFDNAWGIAIQNGTLIARGAAPWAAGRAVLEANNPVAAAISNITIEGNQLANGIWIDRPAHVLMSNVNIWGVGTRQYGFKSIPAFGGVVMSMHKVTIYGNTAAAASDGIDDSFQAVGFQIGENDVNTGGSDSEMIGCRTDRLRRGVVLWGGGWTVSDCHFTGGGDPTSPDPDDRRWGVVLQTSSFTKIVGCTFDHCMLRLEGDADMRVVVGNFFYKTAGITPFVDCAIELVAKQANQRIPRMVITDNFMYLVGTGSAHALAHRFINLVETGGNTWAGMYPTLVGNNVMVNQSALPCWPSATFGSFSTTVTTTDFNSGFVTYIDMTDMLLKAQHTTNVPQFHLTGVEFGTSTNSQMLGWTYNSTTGKIAIRVTTPFAGRITGSFQHGSPWPEVPSANS